MSATPFVPVPNTIRSELVQTWDGQFVENVHHWEFSSNPSVSEMNALGDALKAWYNANMLARKGTAIDLIRIRLVNLTTQTSPAIDYTTGLPIAGTNASAMLPNNVSVVVKWLTALRGRSYRGRTYHFPLFEADVTNNAVSAGVITTLTTAYNNLLNLTMTPTATLVVVSRFQNGLWLSTGVTTPVTGFSIDSTVDSQRRRLPGRGR